jgi:hypothetical protein
MYYRRGEEKRKMKEHCFSIAIEAPNYQKDMLVLGRLVRALHNAGFKYQSIKEIAAQEHWNRAAQQPTSQGQHAEADTSAIG